MVNWTKSVITKLSNPVFITDAMSMIIYHYNKCKKSRAALEFLHSLGIEPVVVSFVENGISEETLKDLFILLNKRPSEMIRTEEEYYKDSLKHKSISEDEWIKIFAEFPKLLKRPIVVNFETKGITTKDKFKVNESAGGASAAVVADPAHLINQLLTDYTKVHEDTN